MRIVETYYTQVPGLGKLITTARKADPRPLTKIAASAGLSPMHWRRIEREEIVALPIETLRKIEKTLELDLPLKSRAREK